MQAPPVLMTGTNNQLIKCPTHLKTTENLKYACLGFIPDSITSFLYSTTDCIQVLQRMSSVSQMC